MKRLIIDTATKNMYLALVDEETLIKEIILKNEKDHTTNIMIKISEILKETTLSNIDEIIVGIGPGSYTGSRIGVTVAKMLAWSKNKRLKSISSLFMMSSGYKGAVAPYIDARRGNVFTTLINDGMTVIDENLYSFETFKMEIIKTGLNPLFITDEMYKADIRAIIDNAKEEKDIHSLIPNYLRETEAERNQRCK